MSRSNWSKKGLGAGLLAGVLCLPIGAGTNGLEGPGADPSVAGPAVWESGLAASLPASTLFYAMIDSQGLADGNLSSGLMSLLEEPGLADFMAPFAQQVPLLQPGALRHMVQNSPLHSYVSGSVELAIQGLAVTIDGQTFEINAQQPISAAMVNRCVGLAATIGAAMETGQPLQHKVSVAPDFLLKVDAGPALRPMIDEAIRQSGAIVRQARLDGHPAQILSFEDSRELPGVSVDLILVEQDGSWMLGGNPVTVARCLEGSAGQGSLAADPAFRRFVGRVSQEDPAMLVYANIAHLGRILMPLVSPIMKEEMDLLGITSIEAMGMASSFAAGGVRDTIALTYNEKPRGLLSLLDLGPGGFRFANMAPDDTSLFVAARMDVEGLVDQVQQVVDDLFPGTGSLVDLALAEANRELPLDLRQEILPALGTEVALYLTAPGGMDFLPRGMLLMEIGDREQFHKVLNLAHQALAQEGVQLDALRSVPEGWEGFTVKIPGAPVQPAFAISGDVLVASLNGLWLRQDLKALEARQSGADLAHKATFNHVMTGLRGKAGLEDLSFLAFVDLRRLVEIGYQFVPMAAAAAPPELAAHMDLSLLPDAEVVAQHFSGIGLAGASDAEGLSLSFFGPVGLSTAWLGGTLGLALGGEMVDATDAPMPMQKSLAAGAPESDTLQADTVVTEDATLAETTVQVEEEFTTVSLSQCFAELEKGMGATILYPERLGSFQVAWTGPGEDLDATLQALSEVFEFQFEVEDRGGERLIRIRG